MEIMGKLFKGEHSIYVWAIINNEGGIILGSSWFDIV